MPPLKARVPWPATAARQTHLLNLLIPLALRPELALTWWQVTSPIESFRQKGIYWLSVRELGRGQEFGRKLWKRSKGSDMPIRKQTHCVQEGILLSPPITGCCLLPLLSRLFHSSLARRSFPSISPISVWLNTILSLTCGFPDPYVGFLPNGKSGGSSWVSGLQLMSLVSCI